MPAYCSHYLFACEMMDFLKEHASFKLNGDAVIIGTQGPDIFFFHRIAPWMPGKSLRKAGSALHRTKPGDILDAMARYCRKSESKAICTSYVYGFILHYALDRQCHPYVYAQQNELTKNGSTLHKSSLHNIIEMSMDSVLLNKKLKIADPRDFNTAATFPNDKTVMEEISRLWEYCSKELLPYKISFRQAYQALRDTRTVQGLLYDKSGFKSKIAGSIENAVSPLTGNYRITSMIRPKDLENAKKYGNISNGIWRSPYEQGERNESFFDLYEIAKGCAKDMICGFDAVLSGTATGAQVTNNLSFLTGVEVK